MTAPKNKIIYKKLPFFPGLSRSLARTLGLEGLRIANYNLTTVNQVFTRLKAVDPKDRTPGVVYSIPCADCNMC